MDLNGRTFIMDLEPTLTRNPAFESSLVVAADDETARGRFCGLSVREVLGTWHTDTDCKQLQLRD